MRVLLNLFSNGFYAATKRARSGAEPDFEPTLKVDDPRPRRRGRDPRAG